LDFAIAGGGTCIQGASFSSGNTCTVNVTFSPKYPGVRNGAVLVNDSLGKTLATAYLYGTGSGPQVRLLVGAYQLPSGLALDGSGNVYVADYENSAVKKIPPDCLIASYVQTIMAAFS